MVKIFANDVNFYDVLNEKKAPVILWGSSDWAQLYIGEDLGFKVDGFCDRDKKVSNIEGIPVYTVAELDEYYCGQEIYVLNMMGYLEKYEHSVYLNAVKLNLDVNLFNFCKNVCFGAAKDTVEYDGKHLMLFEHLHNCGFADKRMTIRTIEVAIAQEWMKKMKDPITEVGAVTPYYMPGYIKDVIDPGDDHPYVTDHRSVFDIDLHNKNVLCISTVEHIGTGEYNVQEKRNAESAIEKILSESSHCLITTEFGHNPVIDSYVKKNYMDEKIKIYVRKSYGNVWKLADKEKINIDEIIECEYRAREVYSRRKLAGVSVASIIIEK